MGADIVVDASYIRARDFDTTHNEGADVVLGRIGTMTDARPTLTPDAAQLLDRAYSSLHMNAADRDRAARVAVTIAGLDHSETVEARHIAEAIQYRSRASI